ncbi:MAG: ClpXP protease specificity-enhancing factor [Burkholderiales bacterium]|jgi:stringent starvation protein B|nr:ClpXP protease specificity-enhancing factor [Burkholderiales bacterium]
MDQTPASGGAGNGTSTRPYLIRALHDWCTDNGFTPYIAVHVDRSVQVPMEYVSNHEIVLNIGFDATSGLDLGNDFIQFKARFGGVAREILVPVDHVVAIYARENGQGMAFPAPEATAEGAAPTVPAAVPTPEPRRSGLRLASEASDEDGGDDTPPPDAPGGGPRPTLKRVK